MRRLTALVEDFLLAWVLGAVALAFFVPGLTAITRYSTPILAVMVGGVSLTLSVADFRAVDRRALGIVLAAHLLMPALAFGVARLLGLSPALTAGFVLLGAVTPELVTPVMTELAGGATALATTVLVAAGVGALVVLPASVTLFLGDAVAVDAWAVVEGVLTAVVAPMMLAVALRTRFPDRVARYEEGYTAVSALMVVLIIAGVTAANAGVARATPSLLVPVALGALALNLAGYALGWTVTARFPSPVRRAAMLSVGMRDFAVAAALIVAAGFPPLASLPAVIFGVLEMTTSAALARWVGA